MRVHVYVNGNGNGNVNVNVHAQRSTHTHILGTFALSRVCVCACVYVRFHVCVAHIRSNAVMSWNPPHRLVEGWRQSLTLAPRPRAERSGSLMTRTEKSAALAGNGANPLVSPQPPPTSPHARLRTRTCMCMCMSLPNPRHPYARAHAHVRATLHRHAQTQARTHPCMHPLICIHPHTRALNLSGYLDNKEQLEGGVDDGWAFFVLPDVTQVSFTPTCMMHVQTHTHTHMCTFVPVHNPPALTHKHTCACAHRAQPSGSVQISPKISGSKTSPLSFFSTARKCKVFISMCFSRVSNVALLQSDSNPLLLFALAAS